MIADIIGFTLLAIYAIGYGVSVRKVFIAILDEIAYGDVEFFDVCMSTMGALLSAIVWPFFGLAYLLYMTTPYYKQERLRKVKKEEKTVAQRIKELERELKIYE